MHQLTTDQIDEQVQLERDQIRKGLKRIQDQTLKLENQNYASATIYGVSSIETLLPRLIECINETNIRLHKGSNGQYFKEVHTYLKDLDTEILYNLGL